MLMFVIFSVFCQLCLWGEEERNGCFIRRRFLVPLGYGRLRLLRNRSWELKLFLGGKILCMSFEQGIENGADWVTDHKRDDL